MPGAPPRRPDEVSDKSQSPGEDGEPLDATPLIEPEAELSERVRLLAKLVRKNIVDQQ